GFSQIIKTLPLRRTILHLAQRFRIDGETFMSSNLLANYWRPTNSQEFNYIRSSFFRPDYTQFRQCHRTVRIRGSPSVTATVCSKCAVSDPSADTTVHWSGKTRVAAVPTNTMGSMATVIPALSR